MNWFDSPRTIDACCYDLVLAEYPRGQNRARINNLANGLPPYSEAEVKENNININVSDLTHTRLTHDARSQYANALLNNGVYARVSTDAGPAHKRSERAAIVTKHWNKYMKRSVRFYERLRAEFGMLVLHGKSPGVWANDYDWCPTPIGLEDVLLPGETLLGFENLPFLVFRRSFTSIELDRLTQKEKRDPGWNMPMVESIQEWLKAEATQLRTLNYPDVWKPEAIAERAKEDVGGSLAGDRAPRIDVFDIYAWDDSGDEQGFVRRMILDSWSEPSLNASSYTMTRKPADRLPADNSGFLYTSNRRQVAKSWENFSCFQFGDLSAVFPAHYHSVRGLGWMLYAACHIGNRMRCKFYESIFEALNMLFEVNSQEDAQNALKLDLVNRGFIDKTIRPVKAADRWQVNAQLIELGMGDNSRVISDNSAAWVQNPNLSQGNVEKTRYQVMAELQAMTSLAGAAMNQASTYQIFEFRENFRRFTIEQSKSPDVRGFQAACIQDGVPAKYLNNPECWEVAMEKSMGAGNQTLAMTIAQQLMQWRDKYDPEAQRKILRDATLAITSDAPLSLELVPDNPVSVTRGVRDAEHVASDLLQGIPVEPMDGENHIEVIETLLRILGLRVQAGMQQGGMVDPKELAGLNAIAQHVEQQIGMLAKDEDAKERVRVYGQDLGKLKNELKAFGQRLEMAMKKQQQQAAQNNGNGGMDPKDMAKVQAMMIQAKTKSDIATHSAAQRTAQKQIQFEQKMKQEQQRHAQEIQKADLEGAMEFHRNRLSSLMEGPENA